MEYGSTLQVLFLNELPLTDLLSPPFNRSAFFYQVFRSQLSISSVSDQDACRAGLQPVSRWKAYGLSGYPGRCPWFQEKWLQPCFFWFRHPSFYLSCPIWKIYFGLPQRNLMFVMLVCSSCCSFVGVLSFKCRRTNTSVKGWDAVIHGD